MATWQWTGGGTSNAHSPSAWPLSGTSIINIWSGSLTENTLHVSGMPGAPAFPMINLFDHASLTLVVDPPSGSTSHPTLNAHGDGTVHASVVGSRANSAALTEHIDAHAVLHGSVQVNRGTVVIEGPGQFSAEGTSLFSNDVARISTDVVGSGTFEISQGALEIGGAVSDTPTFLFSYTGTLTIDDPHRFQAAITDGNKSFHSEQIDLRGIMADSYEFRNDIVTLYSANTVVDTLKLHAGGGNVYVTQGAAGVTVWDSSNASPPAGHLPLHT